MMCSGRLLAYSNNNSRKVFARLSSFTARTDARLRLSSNSPGNAVTEQLAWRAGGNANFIALVPTQDFNSGRSFADEKADMSAPVASKHGNAAAARLRHLFPPR